MATRYGSSFRITAMASIVTAQLLGATALTLMLVWILHFRGGLALNTDDSERLLNAHPVLMLIGLILCSGEAIMAYKIVPARMRNVQKVVHLLLHLAALLVGGLGLYAVFKYSHKEGYWPDIYSLHSWIGLGAICMYVLQWLLGFFSFWYPRAEMPARANILPWHVFAGAAIFLTGVCAAEMGLLEMFIGGRESLLVNFTGLAILLFAAAVVLTVILPRE